jgi:hypothetical protein
MVHPALPEAPILPNDPAAGRTTGHTGTTARTGVIARPGPLLSAATPRDSMIMGPFGQIAHFDP